ncbi:MAG: hypothetical protein CMJ78_19495 [Planctomycetaceae bacterium]|nr:hypothetical protein [Planctomycetaceae bacterium]
MHRPKTIRRVFLCLLGLGLLAVATPIEAQEAPARSLRSFSGGELRISNGRAVQVNPSRSPSAAPKVSSSPKPSSSSSSKKPDNKSANKTEGAKTQGTQTPSGPAVRADTPKYEPNDNAFDGLPEDGKIKINIKGHPWPDVLEWVAKISGLSFDWKELPGDYLNLVTRRTYTVQEVRSMINRHLLMRGYTMLVRGEELTIANVKTINPAMVPRHKPEDLETLSPYAYVKVSFRLDWLLADKLVEELKPMISSNGKLTKLTSTNRIEAMDSVINLQEIHRLLEEEQSAAGVENLVREFPLEFTKAEEILDDLKVLLGMSKGPSKAMTPQQIQQAQQRAMQLAQQNKGKGVPVPPKSEVNLLANRRENSIVAQASPDKMAIISAAIKRLDKPVGGGRSIPEIVDRMQVYRLASTAPESIVEALKQAGTLDPRTTLHVDAHNKAIIAYASLPDHFTIRKMVEKLDGSGRQFHVIPLRKLEAEYVAGTIQAMMGIEQKNQQTSSRSRVYYYGPIMPNRGQNSPVSKFSVEADVEFNRLLLRCNEIELKEVQDLLIQLGEIRVRGQGSTVRVLDTGGAQDVHEVLRRLKEAWPGIAPNKLEIDVPPPAKKPEAEEIPPPSAPDKLDSGTRTEAKPAKPEIKKSAEVLTPRVSTSPVPASEFIRVVQLRREVPKDDSDKADSTESEVGDKTETSKEGGEESKAPAFQPPIEREKVTQPNTAPGLPGVIRNPKYNEQQQPPAATQAPPIRITQAPDGRLVVTSSDPRVLDLLEEIMEQMTPKRTGYKIFKMKYPTTWAFSVRLNLEDFFEEEDDGPPQYSHSPYYGFSPSGLSNNSTRKLGKKRPPRFISDSDTNTILVQGSDEEQLKIIQELIDIYDVPLDSENKSVRVTKAFYLKYSKATVIAQTIKDVYRDLLSSNDRALQSNQGNNKQEKRPVERSYTYIYGAGGKDNEDRDPPIKFKGLLSIGVDELSNTLIISSAEGLMENVAAMVEALDMAARPSSSVQVVPINARFNSSLLQKQLENIFGKGKQAQKPANGQQQRPPNQKIVPNQNGLPQQPR